ncbi:MAG: MFS transporter, partial [Gammaproteobacteria bacterium]|nr:MFS transporter [Gammaproteobacteria bacterium]
MNSPDPGPATTIKATAALGGIFFLRMFGLFLLIPVLSLYAIDLDGATPLLVGLALGIYGLTQGLLQIPLGMLSDRAGRKPVILGGLCLFIAGSLIAATGDHIITVILGRALQ